MIKKLVKGLLAYITIAGVVTLSLFMLEEAFQTAMFGTWAAQDAQQWQVVKTGADIMTGQARTLRTVNNLFGWIQPLAWFSYHAYADSADLYVDALRSKTFAHAPELFVGEPIDFYFTPTRQYQEHDDYFGWWVAQGSRILVLVDSPLPQGRSSRIMGEVGQTVDGILFIDLRD